MTHDKIYIYGKHALTEALMEAPHSIKKVYFAAHMDDAKLRALVKKHNIPVAPLTAGKGGPEGVSGNVVHQGVIGVVSVGALTMQYQRFIDTLAIGKDTVLVLLGEVQDPHNVGAIIRSAAAFGASGVLIPEHNQAPITGAVVKVSAGMAFRVPLISIGNVNHTIADLKKRGFWTYGLAGEGRDTIDSEQFDRPTLFVVGNESSGIREKTREACDKLLSIPMHPKCESLNVAASTAVALYAWARQHPNALQK
ncbi:MAG: 23S rRNA (guanosine(2251)-2'-O)-methyltransferase RlmB [Patescibacteria group bacterium]